MLEAMRLGTPVLVTDRPYAHAVCDEGAIYFDPTDAWDLARAVRAITRSKDLRKQMIHAGQRRIAERDTESGYSKMIKYIRQIGARGEGSFSSRRRRLLSRFRVVSGLSRGLRSFIKQRFARAGYVVLRADLHHNLVREIHDAHVAGIVQVPEVPGRTELLAGLMGTGVSQAMHMIYWLHATHEVPGDVCEFGVAQGATSALLANELMSVGDCRTLWLYDSFVGLPAPTKEDVMTDDVFGLGSIESYEGQMATPRSVVEARLENLGTPSDRFRIVEGFVTEQTPQTALPPAVSFAYIDFDFYQPIREALRLLDGVLSSGGLVVVDDFGHFSEGARSAVSEFKEAHDEEYELTIGPTWAGRFALLRRR